jgi:Zn-finger nucleic acid-binding protein
MPDKPSRNEEEYFARAEAGRLKALAQKAADEAKRAERASHYMKCPKCGADLRVEGHWGIEVDRCPECDGLWFDAGEAQRLVALNERRGVSGIFRSVVEAVRSPASAKKPVE